MKAITLQQPWATLVAIGAKRLETRSWRTNYRGPLAIAASAKQGKEGKVLMADPQCYGAMQLYGASQYWGGMIGHPYGAVIAVCNLVDCLPMESHICLPGIFDEYPELNTIRERAFGDFDVIDRHNGRRRWAFVLEDVQPLVEPIPVKGGLSLWNFARDFTISNPCGECGGTGEITNDGRYSLCDDCKGTGYAIADFTVPKHS